MFFQHRKKQSNKTKIRDIIMSSPERRIVLLREKIWTFTLVLKIGKFWKFMGRHHVVVSLILVFAFSAFGFIAYRNSVSARQAKFFPSTALGNWENPQNASGKPEFYAKPKKEDFNNKNSAVLNKQKGELYLGKFEGNIPKDSEPKQFKLDISWFIEKLSDGKDNENISEENKKYQKDILEVSYTLDSHNWKKLGQVNAENWQGAIFKLPLDNWSDLSQIQIAIKSIDAFDENTVVYVDGVTLIVDYQKIDKNKYNAEDFDKLPSKKISADKLFGSGKKDFQANEPAEFEIKIPKNFDVTSPQDETQDTGVAAPALAPAEASINKNLQTGQGDQVPTPTSDQVPAPKEDITPAVQDDGSATIKDATSSPEEPLSFEEKILRLLNIDKAIAQTQTDVPVRITIIGPAGNKLDITPIVIQDGQNIKITLPEQGDAFQPGKYKMIADIISQGQVINSEQDFNWGTIDSEKNSMATAVLDERGNPINFNYTDENSNENLIIKTDKKVYSGISSAEVYFSVTNIGKSAENVGLQAYLPKNDGEVKKIEKLAKNVPYNKDVSDYESNKYFCKGGWEKNAEEDSTDKPTISYQCLSSKESKICENISEDNKYCTLNKIKTGSHKETEYKDEWKTTALSKNPLKIGKKIQKKPVANEFQIKKSTQMNNSQASANLIGPGETEYFKMEITFLPQTSGEFYIEAIGDKSGYGLLDPWYNGSWAYRKQITLSSGAGAGTNYQVKLLVGESIGSIGYNFHLEGHGKNDFSDLRFTASDETTELSYWIQGVTGTTPNQTATVWVKVTEDLGSAVSIYAYYGNAGASVASNGDNTFLFFDDFPGSSVDGTKWDQGNSGTGTVTVSGGTVTIGSGGDWWGGADTSRYLVSKSSMGTSYATEAYVKQDGTSDAYNRFYGLRSGSGTDAKQFVLLGDSDHSNITNVFRDSVGGSADWYQENSGIADPGVNKIARFEVMGDTVKSYYNNSLTNSRTVSGWGLGYIALTDTNNASYPAEFDWVFARKFVAAEPAYSSAGSELQIADTIVTSTGSQTSSMAIPSTNQYVGGGFVITSTSVSLNLTGITITEHGTVNAQTNLANVKLFYDLDTSAPYDCASESYSGSESPFGSPGSFNGADGTASFTGSVGISPTSAMCVYVVLDVGGGTTNNQTLDIKINNPSTDVTASTGSVGPATPTLISGTTTLLTPANPTQIHYRWRNDDGAEADTSWYNASWLYRKKVTINAQSGAGTNYQVKLLVGESSGSTGYNFHVAGYGKSDFSDLRFTDNDGTTELPYWIQSTSGTTPTQTATVWVKVADDLSSTNADIYAYYGDSSASAVSSGDSTFIFFDDFNDGSVNGSKWTQGGTMTEASGVVSGSTSGTDYLLGKTRITINTLTAVRMRSKSTSGVARPGVLATNGNPYNTVGFGWQDWTDNLRYTDTYDSSITQNSNYNYTTNWNILETAYTSAGVVFITDGVTTRTHTTQVPTSDKVLYGQVDGNAEYDYFFSRKYVATEPAYSSVGSEEAPSSGASFAANEDISLTGLAKLSNKRLRIEISNAGGLTFSNSQYRLEVSQANPASCAAGTYTRVSSATDWQMVDSSYITDGNPTVNISPGLTDANATFVAGQSKDTGDQAGNISLTGTQFTELEYSIEATANATSGANYCFRLTNAGSTTSFTYTQYAEVTIEAATITVSGTSNMGSGTVAVAVNSSLQSGKTGSISGGTWSIASVIQPSTNDIITVWVDGAADANESTGVTKYVGSGNVSGMVLNQHVLSIGNSDNKSLTVANLGQYDNDQDEDIMHSANSGTLNVDANNAYSDEKIDILSGNTLTIGGSETLTTHDIAINGTLASGGASTYNISGFWNNNGIFTSDVSTVTLDGSDAQNVTCGGTTGNYDFFNLTVTNNSASGTTFADDCTVTGTFNDNIQDSKLIFTTTKTYAFANLDIDGAASHPIIMTSTNASPGTPSGPQWLFNVSQASPTVSYVTAYDSNANGGSQINATSNCTDGGNNAHWNFGGGALGLSCAALANMAAYTLGANNSNNGQNKYTFDSSEKCTITNNNSSPWTFTVQSSNLTGTYNTVANTNVLIVKDGIVISGDTITDVATGITEGSGEGALNVPQSVISGSSSAVGTYNNQPTMKIQNLNGLFKENDSGTITFTLQ